MTNSSNSNNGDGAPCPKLPDLDLLTPPEAATYLRVSKSYLDKLRVYGGGPKFLRPGKRKILYRKSELDVWAADRTFTSTSEYENPRKTE
jgi:excisionase family DNA binding protein